MDQPNYYAIIPANVRYDENLKPNAKLLYGELTALCNRDGFCWAGNDYFADLYKVDQKTISRWISQLVEGSYIQLEIFKNEGNKRKIFLANSSVNLVTKKSLPSDKKITRVVTKRSLPSDKKITSNIRINNTINNTVNREENALAFFQQNSPSDWEIFQMRFRKEFDQAEWGKFIELFNLKADEESLEYTIKKINARLTRFAINYVENMKKPVKQLQKIESEIVPPSRKRIS